MFTDWSEALEAESLPLDPTTEQQLAAAARATAHHSHDKHDLTLLLDALGLPTDPDTLTALLPLIPETGDTPVTTTPALEATEPIDLERAQEELRSVKAGTRTTEAAPTGARTGGSDRSREELAAIRSWARANGHQVADQGMVPKRIQEAYDTAHQTPVRENG
ncbi:histone-like nucleoid-structuring protein Lsr2 [Streptomyces griseus]|uniref:Lsr2 family DNA-binding protein n=1 Tax=Streptomyces griseus TaxID=1911 RepID=UPI003796A8C1